MYQNIFLVEDDPDITRLVRHHLEGAGFAVRAFPTGTTLVVDAERLRPSLMILDVMLPGMDGLELCLRVRQTPGISTTPIIFLTAKTAVADRVLGLELGADDYIPKPFSPRELVARVKAVLRRSESPLSEIPLHLGEIGINSGAMVLTVRGQVVPTTATEYRLIEYLAHRAGRVCSRDHLLESIWCDMQYVTPRSVDVYVCRLRKKIEADPEKPRYLNTVRGVGYRFEVPK